jgi:flagellar FliJ protein
MFRFRLQRVLEMRERKERDAATALAQAQDAASVARRAAEELAARRAEMAGGAARAGGVPVGALHNLAFLLDRMDEHVARAGTAAQAAERAVAEREGALRHAFRDRRTLDRLRERHHDAWRAGAAAADRTLMDEVALSRFGQGGAAGASKPNAPAA